MAIRLIQVGLGTWGESWFARIVSQSTAVEAVAWVEVDAQRLTKVQQRFDLPPERCFTSLDEACAAVPAEAVLITASLPGHVPATRAALLADKHVLLEKPFAPTLAEAQALVELAEQRNRILMISQNYRFDPAVSVVTDLVHTQALGPVSSVEIDFRRSNNLMPPTNALHYQLWHPLLVDMAIHHFDLMRVVLGQRPLQIMCKTWNPPWSNFAEPPAAALMVTFSGGVVVSYRGSWISHGPITNWTGEWRMECETGEIAWTSRGDLPARVLVRQAGKDPQAMPLPDLTFRDRAGSLQAFARALADGAIPQSSGRDNLQTLALLFAAIESAESGLPVALPENF